MKVGAMATTALLGAALASCTTGGGSGAGRPRTVAAAAVPRPSIGDGRRHSAIVVVPEVMNPQGLEGVIGVAAAALTRRFGTPRLDLAEGDARKLQFTGGDCVLDIYLYPVSAGAEPTATHVEARQRAGGAASDPGACIRALERR